MRYSLEGRNTLAGLLSGGGLVAGAVGIARGLAKKALGPVALPLAVGSGMMWLGRSIGESFVELEDGLLRVKLGALFDETVSVADIERVEEAHWSLIRGLGLRTNLSDLIAITTKSGPVAEITFKVPQSLPALPAGLWFIDVKRLIVSPEHLGMFIDDLRIELAKLEGEQPADKAEDKAEVQAADQAEAAAPDKAEAKAADQAEAAAPDKPDEAEGGDGG